MKKIKNYFLISAVLFCFFFGLQRTYAAKIGFNKKILLQEKIVDDIYAAGETIVIENNVEGDVYISAKEIIIKGNIQGDLAAAATSIIVDGNISDDARLFGQDITINGKIGDNFFGAGENITFTGNSVISGECIAYGSHVILEGEIRKKASIKAKIINIRGKILENAELAVSESLFVDKNAFIGKNLIYSAPEKIPAETKIVHGDTIYTPLETYINTLFSLPGGSIVNFLLMLYFLIPLIVLLFILFTGSILILLFQKYIFQIAVISEKSAWKSLLIGTITLFAAPIFIGVLFGTIIGIPLAILTFIFIITLIILGKCFAGLIIGQKFIKIHKDNVNTPVKILQAFILGTLILTCISFIPVFGWIIDSLLELVFIGAIIIFILKKRK